jgi:outer membrane protein OmpA-like peptidoglycan-associated protein
LAANYALSGPHRFAVLSPLTGLPVVSMPLAPEAPPARTAAERSFRNVPGLDAVHTHLLASFGTFMVPGDLEPPSPDATLADSKVDPSATAPVQVPVPDMPAPEVRIATLADAVPVIRGNDLPPQGVTIVFGADEAFAHGKASLSPAGRMLLEREIVQPYRAGRPIARLMITGHADPTGSESYNRRLSRRRALAGQAFLLERGIPAAMIQAEGRGSSKSLPGLKCAPGDIACLGPERRIEIHVAPRR